MLEVLLHISFSSNEDVEVEADKKIYRSKRWIKVFSRCGKLAWTPAAPLTGPQCRCILSCSIRTVGALWCFH